MQNILKLLQFVYVTVLQLNYHSRWKLQFYYILIRSRFRHIIFMFKKLVFHIEPFSTRPNRCTDTYQTSLKKLYFLFRWPQNVKSVENAKLSFFFFRIESSPYRWGRSGNKKLQVKKCLGQYCFKSVLLWN